MSEIERFLRPEPLATPKRAPIRIGLEIEVETDDGPKIVTVGKVFDNAGTDVKIAMRPLPSFDRTRILKQRHLMAALIAMRITNLITDGIAAAIDNQPPKPAAIKDQDAQ